MEDEVILEQAMAMSSEELRTAFLSASCRDAPEQRWRIERLLYAHFHPDPCLDTLAQDFAEIAAMELAEESLGSWTGPYQLLQRIGEGGMGVVYEAEQVAPIRRRVALKVIKPGMDSAKIIARLEAERQTLAIMDHPNIARMLDAGTTDAGLPYFVMELVDGVPITDFCDTGVLTIRERLIMFVTLCQAVQHAHQKGIIHRDLKPGNVLVEVRDDVPSPKVIDFGVAKAISPHSSDRMLHTELTQTIGTPLYMSPEQATQSNPDIDTRSDVYSLGVLLYEILTGHTPFDRELMREAGTDEMRRVIRDVDPPRPSTRVSGLDAATLSTMAESRRTTPGRIRQQLHGELDWIIMKSLEKDRRRRYESASALAADIQRFLDDIPVLASPPSAAYWLKKFVVRHRVGVVTAVLVSTAILLTSAISVWKYFGEREARREMETQRNLAIESRENLEQYLYAADMNLAMKTAANGYVGRVQTLLERHVPRSGEKDIRGFAWFLLDRWKETSEQLGKNFVVFRGHTADVYFLAVSPDGTIVASASKDHTVRLWNANSGQLLRVLRGHSNEVNSVAFSADGRTLASASDDRSVRIWDLETGEELWSLKGFLRIVIRVQFSPDGETLAATEAVLEKEEVSTTLWDVSNRTLRNRLENQLILAFSPNGAVIATAGRDKVIRVINLETQILLAEMNATNDHTPFGVFSNDGKRLVTCGHLMMATIWDTDTGHEIR